MKRGFLLALLAACHGGGPRDLHDGPVKTIERDAGSFAGIAPPPLPRPTRRDAGSIGSLTRLARASSRALAMDASRIYFGSSDDDTVMSISKEGGDAVRLGRRAPVSGALALDGQSLVWVATPGDVVLKLSVDGGPASTLRSGGIFVDVASSNGECFVAEAGSGGGSISRVVAGSTVRFAALDASPRALAIDDKNLVVATPSKILMTSRAKANFVTLATGVALDSPVLDVSYVYFTRQDETTRNIVRVPRAGGDAEVVATRSATAPFAVVGDEIYFFDGRRAELRVVTIGGTPRAIASDESFSRPNAILVDEKNVYLATGEREDGQIFSVPRP